MYREGAPGKRHSRERHQHQVRGRHHATGKGLRTVEMPVHSFQSVMDGGRTAIVRPLQEDVPTPETKAGPWWQLRRGDRFHGTWKGDRARLVLVASEDTVILPLRDIPLVVLLGVGLSHRPEQALVQLQRGSARVLTLDSPMVVVQFQRPLS